MKLSLPKLLGIFLLLLALLPFFSPHTYAGSLDRSLVKLDRLKANTATGGTVCAETPSSANGTVSRVALTFPSGFTVDTDESNWTVTTSDIPSGATAWPGIGTATSVMGNTVIFPSSNLSTSTYYCFNFSGNNTLTTGTSDNDLRGTISTQTAGGATIDYQTYALSIVNNDGITVTATAPADPDDFETDLRIDNNQEAYAQNNTLYFTLRYRSNLSYSTTITLEAEWSLGRFEGTTTPIVDVLRYVNGSASNAHNNTPVVVDTVNRKIYWTISSFPGNTEKAVTFQLATTANHTGVETIYFDVSSRILGPGTETPDFTITKKLINNYVPPSSPGPSSTPTPAPDKPPASKPDPLVFTDIEINSVNSDSAEITVSTNRQSTLRINYGTSINRLNETVNYPEGLASRKISLTALKPDTPYFFRISATETNKTSAVSDTYSFRTASLSEVAKINFSTLVFYGGNNLFTFPGENFTEEGKRPFIVIPKDTDYQFRFSLQGSESVKRIRGILKSSEILGLASAYAQERTNSIELSEIEPGTFLGSFSGISSTGLYEIYIQIFDNKGNISETKIANARIVKPLVILSKSTKSPVENAIVLLYWYNFNTRTYSLVPSVTLGSKNPVNSLYDGTIPVSLSAGKYKADINALGFKKTTIEFTIGPGKGETYPEVYLEPEPFNLLTLLTYYGGTLLDVFYSTNDYISNLSLSVRFFDLIAATSLILLTFTVLFSFSVRTHMHFRHMPLFFLYNIEDILGFSKERYVYGILKEDIGNRPVPGAKISLNDAKTGKLLYVSHTNKWGEFFLRKPRAELYDFVIEKKGYDTLEIPDYLPNALTGKLKFTIQKQGAESALTMKKIFRDGIRNFVGFLFEFLLLNSIILESIFVRTQGLTKTLPFIILTVLTIIIWLFYAKRVLGRMHKSY